MLSPTFFKSYSFIFLAALFNAMSVFVAFSSAPCPSESAPVINPGDLVSFLATLQETALQTLGPLNFDPKLYVDYSVKTKYLLKTVKEAFTNLSSSENGTVSVQNLTNFIKTYLNDPEDDLRHVTPPDFKKKPLAFLPLVNNTEVRRWALEVHFLWANLSRKVSDDILAYPDLHTLLPLNNSVIIPGSRFREVYYWDSYWIIRGLLVSKMYDTAKGIVTNLISLLHEYGFVLNGARKYYTNRSQPPLLSAMIYAIFKETGDINFVNNALPALLTEHQFWTTEFHKVTFVDGHGFNHSLSRYYAMLDTARPESSTIDKALAANMSTCEQKHLFREIATTAETGWDFSSRWMRDRKNLKTLITTSIVPVDLNTFILQMELNIAFMANATGNHSLANQFLEKSQERKNAIDAILWNNEKKQWLDYWLSDSAKEKNPIEQWNSSKQNQDVYASNFIPLWLKPFYSDKSLVKEVMESLNRSGLIREFGIATSLNNTGQQWDFPNGWAPCQHIITEGLKNSNLESAKNLASDLAVRWLKTNAAAFYKTGVMHEKYDVEKCGEFGGGGEYKSQTGFGWSNGVVLAMLEEFGWPDDLKFDFKCGN